MTPKLTVLTALALGSSSAALFAAASAWLPDLMWAAALLWATVLLGVSSQRSAKRASLVGGGVSALMGALASAHLWGIGFYSWAVYGVVIGYHALIWGSYGALASRLLYRGSAAGPIAAAALWALLESLRGIGAFSFPFFFGGMLATEVYPVQVASLFGSAGVSFVLLLTGFALASPLLRWLGDERMGRRPQWAPGLLVCAATWLFGLIRVHATDGNPSRMLKVGTTQGSVPSWMYGLATGPGPFRRVVEEHYGSLYRATREQGAQLVLFPETAFDWHLRPTTDTIRRIAPFSADRLPPKTGVLFGASFTGLEKWDSVNGVGVLTGDPEDRFRPVLRGVVEKRQLVPFIEVGHRRANRWLLAEVEGTRVGVLVCYESMYPAAALHHARAGAELLVVLSDDGGMMHSRLAWTHAEQAKLRAVETGLPLVRAGQAGPSYVVDSLGRQGDAQSLDHWAVGYIVADIPLERRPTLYRHLGQWTSLLWLGLVLVVPLSAFSRRKKADDDDARAAD